MAINTVAKLSTNRVSRVFTQGSGSSTKGHGHWVSSHFGSGYVRYPGSAAPNPTAGLAGETIVSSPYCLPIPTNVTGNLHMVGFSYLTQVKMIFMLADRLWQNSGIDVTVTTAQTIDSVAWPARDRNGSTNGEDVLIGIDCSTATGNSSAVSTITMSYTNSDGVAGRTGTITTFPASMGIGGFAPFELDAGDIGVRSVQSITLGTSLVSGSISLVAFRVVAFPAGAVDTFKQVTNTAFQLGVPRLYEGTSLFYLATQNSQNSNAMYDGLIEYAVG